MFANGEIVTFVQPGERHDPYSGEIVRDDWGNPEVVAGHRVGIEPLAATEPEQDGRQSMIVGYRLYFDRHVEIDRLWRVEVRGETWDVEGRPAVWHHPMTGWKPGMVVQVGGADG